LTQGPPICLHWRMSHFRRSQVWISDFKDSLTTSYIFFFFFSISPYANSITRVVIDIKQKHWQNSHACGVSEQNHLQNKRIITEVHCYDIWFNHPLYQERNRGSERSSNMPKITQPVTLKSPHPQSTFLPVPFLPGRGKIVLSLSGLSPPGISDHRLWIRWVAAHRFSTCVWVCVFVFTSSQYTKPRWQGLMSEKSILKPRICHVFSLWPWPGYLPGFDFSLFICKMRINKGTVLLFSILGILFKCQLTQKVWGWESEVPQF